MVDDRSDSGRTFLKKAATACLGLTKALVGCEFGLLLLILFSGTADANPPPIQASMSFVVTGVTSDLAINGAGYFVVRDPVSGHINATRNGNFTIDENGYFVTADGLRVQGLDDPTLTAIGDVRIDAAGWRLPNDPSAVVSSFTILGYGAVQVTFSDGSSAVACQILLQNFQNPSTLMNEGNRCFGWTALAGPLPQIVAPGTTGTGSLLSGFLEQLVPELQLSHYAGPPRSFTQGILIPTSVPTDLGIEGNGFFVLRRTNDNAFFATRAGAFYLDGSGYLVHYSGLRLQGYVDVSASIIGDLRISSAGMPSGWDQTLEVDSFSIDRRGTIAVCLPDGSTFMGGQILLQDCANPDLVARTNFDLYPILTNADLWSPPAPPVTGNLGWIVPGEVELSQFDTNLLDVRQHLNFFIEGPIESTGVPSNLAISGIGFFTVRDPVANVLYATRMGDFQLDPFGHLATTNGLLLQGLTNSDLTEAGDITIDTAGASDPTIPLECFYVASDGAIDVVQSDGSVFLREKVLLQNYRNLQGLILAGNCLYSNLTAALPIFTNGMAGCNGLGTIQSGYLESPSGVPAALHLPPSSGLRLFINNLTAGTVEGSSDMIHWDVVCDVCGSDLSEAEFFDTPETSAKFYRVVASY